MILVFSVWWVVDLALMGLVRGARTTTSNELNPRGGTRGHVLIAAHHPSPYCHLSRFNLAVCPENDQEIKKPKPPLLLLRTIPQKYQSTTRYSIMRKNTVRRTTMAAKRP